MPLVTTILDLTLGHCHSPVDHLLKTNGIGAASQVFIGPSKAAVVVVADAYTPTTCGDTTHAPVVTVGSTNVSVGPSKLKLAYAGTQLSCGDTTTGNPINKVFVN